MMDEEEELKMKALGALKHAVHCYPLISKLLLEKNKVNVAGRSFQTDWPSVLSPLSELHDSFSTQEGIIAGLLGRDLTAAKKNCFYLC